MCLIKVEERIENPTDEIIVGWKVYIKDGPFDWLPACRGPRFLKGTWVSRHNPQESIVIEDAHGVHSGMYPSGFHVYEEEKPLLMRNGERCPDYITLKVFIRRVRTIGFNVPFYEGNEPCKCYVADEIYVPLNDDDVPPELRKEKENQ